jgi:hypothetical protein
MALGTAGSAFIRSGTHRSVAELDRDINDWVGHGTTTSPVRLAEGLRRLADRFRFRSLRVFVTLSQSRVAN